MALKALDARIASTTPAPPPATANPSSSANTLSSSAAAAASAPAPGPQGVSSTDAAEASLGVMPALKSQASTRSVKESEEKGEKKVKD